MTKTTATAKATEIAVTTLGPNGINDASFHVHAKGCKDADNRRRYGRSERYDEMVTSMEQMTVNTYSDHMAEADYENPEVSWLDYRSEFKVFPCVSIPESEADALAPKKAGRKPAAKKAKAAPRTPRATVGVYGVPVDLAWDRTVVDGVVTLRGVGARDLYRVVGSNDGGWFAEARMTKGGHWVSLAGATKTAVQAKKLAGWYERGARWLAYSKFTGVAFDALPKAA